ncbi:MAG: hypothetical protein PHY95_02035 [Candidatus ainarchaeum sp.]|nr:hypothetical protein [Candidatus ainarchaeum sp.]
MVNCSMYYSTFREEKGNYLLRLPKLLPKDWKLHVLFRYKYAGLDDPDMAGAGKFYLYDHFRDLTEAEITGAEKLVNTPFSLMRLMAKTAFMRYPDMRNLPDDKFLANCALAWDKFFTTRKIDAYLAGLIDETSGIVGLEVAKKRGIPVLMLHPSRFTNAFFICDGDYAPIFWKKLGKEEVAAQYAEAKREILGEKIINAHVSKIATNTFDLTKVRTLLQLLLAVPRNFYYYHVKIPAPDRKLWNSTEELVVRQMKYFTRSSLYGRYMLKSIPKGEKFVFFPLHFTDDAAFTAKFAIDSQFEIIEKIAKLLPHDTYLYVKPHPHWKACDVPVGVMKRMAMNPKIRMLTYKADTKRLVREAKLTVIINSAVGMEALLAGMPVVAFGKDYPPDVIPRVRHVTEIFDAAKRQAPRAVVERFVANVRAHSFQIDSSVFSTAEIYRDDDIKTIVGHFVEAYESMKAGGRKG